MLTGLKSTLIELREAQTDESFIYAKKIAKELEIPTSLPEKGGQEKKYPSPQQRTHYSVCRRLF
jgi:hypothetical protein